MSDERSDAVIGSAFPEVGAGGYTRVDGSVEFYSRVQSLLEPRMKVLDFGAGRAHWFEDDECAYRRSVRQIRGKVAEVIACDVDAAVMKNRAADRTVLIESESRLPFADRYFDLIVADYVFEHVRNPDLMSRELARILANGGWICARTPNVYGYVTLLSRLVANRFHVRLLRLVQPSRKAIDVFPTAYRLNTLRAVSKHFDSASFDNFSYRYDAEPAYFFGNRFVFGALRLLQWLLPPQCSSQLFIFLRKR